MTIKYIPANVPGQQNMTLKDTKYVPSCNVPRLEHGLSWWKDDCFFKYPYLLVSAAYGMKHPDMREKFGIGKEVLMIADSGGFQVVTQGEYLNPIDVLRWLENNCDIGFILDYPPYWDNDTASFGELRDFEKNMNITTKNTEIMTTKKENEKLKLYGVVQGDNHDRIQQWYNQVKDFEVDGWSLAPKPSSDVFKIAMYGTFAIENLDTPIHVFAVSGISTMAITIYLSKYYKHLITFDSSSYAKGCTFKDYTVPFNMNLSFNFGNDGHKPDTLPCDCPVCHEIEPKDLWASGSMSGALISLHNLYWYVTYSYTLQSLVKYDDLFMEFVKKICTPRTLQAIEYIDYFMDTKNIDRANARYSNYLTSSSGLVQERFRV